MSPARQDSKTIHSPSGEIYLRPSPKQQPQKAGESVIREPAVSATLTQREAQLERVASAIAKSASKKRCAEIEQRAQAESREKAADLLKERNGSGPYPRWLRVAAVGASVGRRA